MANVVNSELMKLARDLYAEKVAVVPPGGGAMPDPTAMGMVPPATPEQAAAGAVPPPADPAASGAVDPSMLGALPPAPAAPPAQAPASGTQQKLKPEQMMQMLDYRMYNMQQILTAMANALGVQIDPSALVLPPGTTGAPPAEMALPGGPMAPPPAAPDAAAGGQAPPPADPAAAGMAPPKMAADVSLRSKIEAATLLRQNRLRHAR